MIWGVGLHYTSLRFSMIFLMDFPHFSRIFHGFLSTDWCHRHVDCRPGSWATVPPLLLTEPMTRSCWRRPPCYLSWFDIPSVIGKPMENHRKTHRKMVINGDLPSGELTFCHGKIHHAINGKIHYQWPCSIAMLNYQRVSLGTLSYHCLGDPAVSQQKMVTFCRCTARGRGQAGDEDASSGSQGKTTGKFRHKDDKEMLKRWSKERTSKKCHKVDLGISRELMYRVWVSKIPTRDM